MGEEKRPHLSHFVNDDDEDCCGSGELEREGSIGRAAACPVRRGVEISLMQMLLRMLMDGGLTLLVQRAEDDDQDGGAHHSAEAEA